MSAKHGSDNASLEALRPLLRRVRTTDSAIKKRVGSKNILAWTDEPIDASPEGRERLLRHLNGGPYRGASPMQYNSTSTMVSLYDLDSHGGDIPWPEMLAVARRLMEAMRLHGLEPVAFRSSGGRGIHIYCLWEEGQDAYSVRELMKAILLQLGYKEGAGGVAKREIEIFPKRDSMGEKKTVIRKGKHHVTRGSQFILPLAAESVPLDPVTLAVLPRMPTSIKWPMSKQVNVLVKPERRPRYEGEPGVGLEILRSALAAIPNEDEGEQHYDVWIKLMAALHYETQGDGEGLELAHEFSSRHSKYNPDLLDYKWDSFDDERDNPVTGGTIILTAREHGWSEFDVGKVFGESGAGDDSADEWPEPHPLPAALPPVPPFDLAMLPAALRPWIKDIAERMQVGPDIPAIGAVVALSGAIGRRVQIMPKAFDEWAVVPNLWGMVVAPPGYMKSPALAEVMKPLHQLESEASREYEKAMAAWEQEKAITKLRKRANEHLVLGRIKKGEDGLPEMLPEPEEPVARRYVVNNFSTEALGEVLIGNPNGVLAFSDELSGLLIMSQKPGNEGMLDFLLAGWNGYGAYTFDRIGRGLNHRVDDVCLAALGGIQPGRLIEHIDGATQGGAAIQGWRSGSSC